MAALAAAAFVGLVASSAWLAGQEPVRPTQSADVDVATVRDDLGRVVETESSADHSLRRTFDSAGHLVLRESLLPSGKWHREHILNDANGVEIGRGRGLSDAQFRAYLDRLGLAQGAVLPVDRPPGESGRRVDHPWGSMTKQRSRDRGEVTVEILGRKMTVRMVKAPDVVRTSDDWGVERTDTYGSLPVYMSSHVNGSQDGVVRSEDAWGLIAELVVDAEGHPSEVRLGDNLLVRYHYDPDLLRSKSSAFWATAWTEIIDLRTGDPVLDSRLLPAEARSLFRVGPPGAPGIESGVDGSLFAVVPHPAGGAHGFLPVEEGEVWRRVAMGDGDTRLFGTVVDYQADRLRVHFGRPEFTVEAPRDAASGAPVALLFPRGVVLPLAGDSPRGVPAGSVAAAEAPLEVPVSDAQESAGSASDGSEEGGGNEEPVEIGYVDEIDVVGDRWQVATVYWLTPEPDEVGRRRLRRVTRSRNRMQNWLNAGLNQARKKVDS